MHISCSVPLQEPWSPVGYRVVEVMNEKIPRPTVGWHRVARAENAPREAPWAPSSPLGYRVVLVEEEKGRQPCLRPPIACDSRKPSSHMMSPHLLWGSIAAGFLLVTVILIIATLSSGPNKAVSWVSELVREVPLATSPEVLLPNAGASIIGCGPMADPPQVILPQGPVVNEAWTTLLEAEVARGPDKGQPNDPVCATLETSRPLAERENFGTAVSFARNPGEAARSAAQERKLTFLLHVSGNFEEARFT